MTIVRNALAGDEKFCRELYYSTRRAEVSAFGWEKDTAERFLTMQFTSRERAYHLQYPDLIDSIVELDGIPIGRLITSPAERSLVLIDIALLPDHQRSGIGTRLVTELQAEASALGKRVILRVDKSNLIAAVFYKKLGFEVEDQNQINYSMSWQV